VSSYRLPIEVKSRNRRSRWRLTTLLATVALLAVAHAPLLHAVGSFLILEDPLTPATAILALGGGTPFREMEAAKLYKAGWASRVIIGRDSGSEETKALEQLGVKVQERWEVSRDVLVRLGVPTKAIRIAYFQTGGTLEELKRLYDTFEEKEAPVILVTSKVHTRRTRLTWNYVTEGRVPAIVRAVSDDSFTANGWWKKRRSAESVLHEYLELINYYAGFPVAR
jgi:uncharacterized SAM-binding protein YcdF (DUF218 family)